MCMSAIRRYRNRIPIRQIQGRGLDFPVWRNVFGELVEHANMVLTNITSFTLMRDYHGLGEHRA